MTSPEDMISDMFGEFSKVSGGQNVSKILFTLIRNAQISMLKQLRQELDMNINRLIREGADGMAYDEALDPFKILGVEQNATKEDIKKGITGEEFSKDYGLCRSCFVNLRNRVGEQ